MSRYAAETTVPVERTKAEIEQMLIRYGATEFQSGWQTGRAMIGFRLKELYVRFELPFPSRDDPRFKRKKTKVGVKILTETQSNNLYEQVIKSRWRALLLTVKAKLEAVEIGITTLEKEFLAFIVLPGTNCTIGQWIIENAMKQIRGGETPKLLPDRPQDHHDVQDAEIVKS